MNPFLDYLFAAIALGVTFLYGCTGEIITEKAGHLNLGTPGIMCIGGAAGCLALYWMNGSGIPSVLVVILSVLFAFAAGAAMGALYSFLCVTLKSNQNVTGLAMTIFGAGATRFIMLGLADQGGMGYLYARDYFRFPFASQTTSLKYNGILVYVGIAIAVATTLILRHSRVGLHLRSVGENPATADAVGINVTGYKYAATCIGSGISALGGFFYIIDYSGSFEAYKSVEALGWVSVALVIFTLWNPIVSVAGSILFGLLYLAGERIPALLNIQVGISTTKLFELLPYVVTIIVLIVTSISRKRENQPPASLGIPYFREER